MAGCDVFISYKREERPRVEVVARKLKEVGLKVWFDTSLDPGASFDEQIAGELKGAKAVLVCWTPGAIASEWVRGEAAMAHGAGKLVAAFLEPTELIPPFNLIHTENLADWSGEDDHAGWAKILARIASMSGQAELTAWAKMMGEGNASAMRSWVAGQPAGPLRSVARFWLSEMHAQPIFRTAQPGAQKQKEKRGGGGIVGAVAALLLIGMVGFGGYYAWRMTQATATDAPAPAADDTNAASAIVAPPPVEVVTLPAGSVLRVPPASLVDFETGEVSTAAGDRYDFEVTFEGTRYWWRSRGAARIQEQGFGAAPSPRQCDELPANDWLPQAMAPWHGSPRFKCFITAAGHRGFLEHRDGYDDSATGLTFAVTYFPAE